MIAHTLEFTETPFAPFTPWAMGRVDGKDKPAELLFGRMHEDSRIEAGVFPKGARVFAIASAGCTALSLARRGDLVTAVDINPAQCEYVRARCRGGQIEVGSIDRLLAAARGALRWIGLPQLELRAFLNMDDTERQARHWREHLDSFAWRTALACTLNPLTLRAAYSSDFVRALPPRFAVVFRTRLERGFARHANCENEYAWRMLLGCEPPNTIETHQPEPCVRVEHADAAEYLENCTPGSLDAFTISNILDGAPDAYRTRLFTAMKRAAAPHARYVLRSLAEPATSIESGVATEDRSMLWGIVKVGAVAELR